MRGFEPRTSEMDVKVALIAPFHEFGGSEEQLLQLLQGLIARNTDVLFLHMHIRSRPLEEALGQVAGCRHVEIRARSVKNPFGFLSDIRGLARQLGQFEADVVHCWNYSGHIIGGLASRIAEIPCVFSVGGLDPWKKPWQLPFYQLLNRLPRAFVFQSRTERDIVSRRERISLARTRIIPNAVDHGRFHPGNRLGERHRLEKELGLPSVVPLLLSVGSLRPIKGYDVLIDAVRQVRERHPGLAFHVLIVGDGALRDVYQTASAGLPITWAGFRTDVERFYRAADAYCQPSRSEGLPNAVIQALCSGLPVVATNVGGLRELVSPENGVLVASNEPGALASGIVELLRNAGRFADMGRFSINRSGDFSEERMVAQYMAVYREAAGGK